MPLSCSGWVRQSGGDPTAGAVGPERGARKVGRPGSGAGWEAAQANGKRRA